MISPYCHRSCAPLLTFNEQRYEDCCMAVMMYEVQSRLIVQYMAASAVVGRHSLRNRINGKSVNYNLKTVICTLLTSVVPVECWSMKACWVRQVQRAGREY